VEKQKLFGAKEIERGGKWGHVTRPPYLGEKSEVLSSRLEGTRYVTGTDWRRSIVRNVTDLTISLRAFWGRSSSSNAIHA